MPYTSVFGAQPIYSAQPSFLELALVADVELDWPLETVEGDNILATIIGVTPSGPGFTITLPDATQGTPGYAVTFTSHGADIFTVEDNANNTVLTVASGESWTTYLRSSLTVAGVWYSFQQGAGVSTTNAASLAGAGLKAISTTLNTKIAVSPQGLNYTIVEADRATAIMWTGGVGQFTLPDPAVVGSDWYVPMKNAGSGSLTVVPTAGTIDGSGSLVLGADESAFFYTDGTNFYTVGLGQEVNSVFDFISINIAGTGDYVLSGVELNRISYKFTGVLTGNRNVIVPASVQQYWIDNETTGAFVLTIKCAGGLDPGKTIAQNNRNIFYCDGANVLDAVSGAFTPPLPVGSGGTGATTAAQARLNLGATPVGDALFTTPSAAAGRGTLGSTVIGDAVFIAVSVAAALTALGASAVGAAVFTAPTAAAARTALGASAIGDAIFTAANAAAVVAGIGAVPTSRLVDTANSLTGGGDLSADRTLQLLNDTPAPGALMVYGTDAGGTRGWQAAGGGSSGVRKFKAASTARTNNTLLDDPDLQGWVLTANKWYAMRGHLILTIAGAVSGCQFFFEFSNAKQFQWGGMVGVSDSNTSLARNLDDPPGGAKTFGVGAGQDNNWQVDMSFQANAAVGGTLDFQWAQSVTNVAAVTLRSGSWLELVLLN